MKTCAAMSSARLVTVAHRASITPKIHQSFASSAPLLSTFNSRSLVRSQQRQRATTQASLTVKEPATGTEFPLVQRLWLGDDYRIMGAGARVKKVAFVGVKVYAIALYVEAEKAAHELGVRDRGGFFETDDDFASALVDGGFIKAVEIVLARDVEGAMFAEALNENLRPRMSLGGELGTLETFSKFFEGRKLTKGTTILLMYRTDATLDIVLRDQPGTDYSQIVADLSLPSASLCRALHEVFLGEKTVVPDAKKEFVKGAKALLDSDKVRRATRKSGGG